MEKHVSGRSGHDMDRHNHKKKRVQEARSSIMEICVVSVVPKTEVLVG